MLSENHEVIAYDNDQLRDQWERRAQSCNDKSKEEQQRKGKSALNSLFKQWGHRLAMRNGAAAASEKKKGDISDFRKYIVSAEDDGEVDESKVHAQFKIKAPPKMPKPKPPSPPPKRKPAPKAAPKPRRKPEVDLLKASWGESWKCLKPPREEKKAVEKEKKPAVEQKKEMKTYKSMGYDLQAKWGSTPSEWAQSWKQMKNPAHMEMSTENQSQWEILSKGKFWRRYDTEVENFSLPVWAGTWKTIMFRMGQEQEKWDRTWPDFERSPSNKLPKLEDFEEKVLPSGWEDSWKSSKTESKHMEETEEDKMSTAIKMKIPNVFLPGWNESWMCSGSPLQNGEECQKNWHSSWGYCQEHRWCKASLESRHRHIDMLMKRRRNKNIILVMGMDEEFPEATEWSQSWKTSKACSEEAGYDEEQLDEETAEGTEVEDEEYYAEDSYVEEEYESEVPLHLQFHKLNSSFSSWKGSWMVSKAHSAQEEEGAGEKNADAVWKKAWKLCDSEVPQDNPDDVAYFSREHKTVRYMGWTHEDSMPEDEWADSWKTPRGADVDMEQDQEESQEESEHVSYYFRRERATHMIEFPASDWKEAWRYSPNPKPYTSFSLSNWLLSWRLATPISHERQDQNGHSAHIHHTSTKHHSYFNQVEMPEAEWNDSWKLPRSDNLDPNTPRMEDNDSGEWGSCWRLLNPQLYLKKESWCQEKIDEGQQEEKKEDLRLHLSFLSREEVAAENRKMINPKIRAADWNESWRSPKPHMDSREK